ncbi:disease resistance protein SUMM2-like [Phaseolus vulgaris]|uniref:disease resistance protein SUMM2-like n=1 Tax=Phaseolus vulgaris TaxID=3885 RepID=UPI0035CAEC3D
MVSIVSDLAKSNLEKLINATLEQSRYICCFTFITREFENERKNLIPKKETLEEYVRVANRRNDNIRREVKIWQKQVEDLIEEDTKIKMTCFFGRCPNFKWQYSRGKELESKTEEIKRLMQCNFENVGIIRDVPDIEYHSSQNYISFESRKLKFEELFNALTNDNNYMIGLQGMGGTGKTTLAKEIGKKLKKSKFFDQVIDTTVSNTPDTKKIQDDIAGPLGLPLKDYTESERPRRLWDRLTNGEKILVVLDDVWGDINFEEIGIPFKDNHNGCKILVTTRNMSICHKMECEKIIQLDILPEEEGWILFQKHAGLSDTSSKSVLNKGHKISKECKGLPIAIAVIAGSLKGQTRPKEWDVALKSLQKSMLVRDDDENWSKVYACLKYSYDNIKNKTAKKLFLLCSVFQEDEEISEVLLVRLAIGAGLIEKNVDDYNYDACRNEVIAATYKLIDSCLLLNGEFGGVKMHDLVREVALSIANKEILAMNTSNKNEMTMVEKGKNIKYLLCEGKSTDVFSFKFDGSKLDILIVYLNEYGYVEVPNSFFENIAGLQVLYLSNTHIYGEATLLLPQSIQLLTNIRSLYLEGFTLGNISMLGILKDLQTLDLVRCSMDELPREISKLVKLKLLNLKLNNFEWNNPYEVIESCTSLEELYLIGNFISMSPHNVKLPNYQRFCIFDPSGYSISKESLVRNVLDLSMADETFSKDTFKNLMQKVELLHLRQLRGVWKNLIPEIIFPDDEGATNLVEIGLFNISQLRCLIDNTDSRVQNALSKRIVKEQDILLQSSMLDYTGMPNVDISV